MKKLNNKGFTIVELVIVVAVIAILAAVLIPTMSNLIKTAQTSADVTLVKNVNLFLATERAAEGKNATMQDALDDALEGGYDISKLTPTNSDNLILWDQESDNFVLYANGKYNNAGAEVNVDENALYKLWNISDKTEGAEHSIYYIGTDTEVTVNGVGFDAGKGSVANVKYENTTGTAKNVVIRTNSANTTLTIDAESDTISHYGLVGTVDVQKVDMNCYNEHGTAAYVKVTEGKVVAKNGGKIEVVFVTSANAIATVDGGAITAGYTTDAANQTNEGIVLEIKDAETIEALANEKIDEYIIEELVSENTNAVARVGKQFFDTVGDAIAATTEDTTIYILKNTSIRAEDFTKAVTLVGNGQILKFVANTNTNDSTLYNPIITQGELKIDLNGKLVWAKASPYSDPAGTFEYEDSKGIPKFHPVITNEGTLTVFDSTEEKNGILTIDTAGNNAISVIANKGIFILESGTIGGPREGVSTTVGVREVLRACEGSETYIKGGTVYGNSWAIANGNNQSPETYSKSYANAFVYISGGTLKTVRNQMFYNKNSTAPNPEITGGTFNYDPSEWVDTAKYNVTANDAENPTSWTVAAK